MKFELNKSFDLQKAVDCLSPEQEIILMCNNQPQILMIDLTCLDLIETVSYLRQARGNKNQPLKFVSRREFIQDSILSLYNTLYIISYENELVLLNGGDEPEIIMIDITDLNLPEILDYFRHKRKYNANKFMPEKQNEALKRLADELLAIEQAEQEEPIFTEIQRREAVKQYKEQERKERIEKRQKMFEELKGCLGGIDVDLKEIREERLRKKGLLD
jgi:hypothetical protein